jgi:hypothetical protein
MRDRHFIPTFVFSFFRFFVIPFPMYAAEAQSCCSAFTSEVPAP